MGLEKRWYSTYTVAKLLDDRCWMTQNLRIINHSLTASDSNVSNTYIIPQSTTLPDNQFVRSRYDISKAYLNPNNPNLYGAYYNWYTATAGEGISASYTSPGRQTNQSICPKEWYLPDKEEYDNLVGIYKNWNSLSASPVNWVAAGEVSNTLISPGSTSLYWTSDGSNTGGYAYANATYSGDIHTSNQEVGFGFNVRCISR